MIDVRDIGRDFMRPRERRREEGREFLREAAPEAPAAAIAPQPIGIPAVPFTPVVPPPPITPPPPPSIQPPPPIHPPMGTDISQGSPAWNAAYVNWSATRQRMGLSTEPSEMPSWYVQNYQAGLSPGQPPPGTFGGGAGAQVPSVETTPPPVTPPTTPWQPIQAAPPGGEGFPYPQQWGWASDALREIAETGMPGITEEYAEKAWLPYQRRGQQEAMQAREEAGLGGLRWSTPLAGRLEDIWGGASERFGSEMERMRLGDIAGQRGARLGATGQLMGLGGQYAGLPLNVASQMMGLGGAQQQMQQTELDRQREEWLRQQPEYNPLLQYMYGGGQVPMGASMYGPSMGGQMFDIAGQMQLAQMLGLFGGGTPKET